MPRVKRGNVARNRRKKVLKLAKGFRGGLSKLYRPAHQVVLHALSYATRDRRNKKRDFRRLWIARISGGLKQQEAVGYAKFIGLMTKKNVGLNRKILANLAIYDSKVFDDIVTFVSKT